MSGAWSAYWGKASTEEAGWHPLPFHCLDVAAVALVYLDGNPRLRRQLAEWLGMPEATAVKLMIVLVMLHDLGKFAENFQRKRNDIFAALFPDRSSGPQHGGHRHDKVGAQLLVSPDLEAALATRTNDARAAERVQALLMVVVAHHGQPVTGDGNLEDAMSRAAQADAVAFVHAAFDLVGLHADELDQLVAGRGLHIAGWWLAGLTILSDWIGSNTCWFPYAVADVRGFSLSAYWNDVALPRAREKVPESGVLNCQPAAWRGIEPLFPRLASRPRPAQALCAELALGAPQLVLLEDATGSGKTEAALILAHRLMAAGLADGLFFGLPTQATADQMYERVDAVGPRLFVDGARPTIVLAHGQREQNRLFRERSAPRHEACDEAGTASQHCSQWLAQGSKRSLLGQIGVGTLDQAQMCGLRVKHQPLRLLGLFGKVLIVDEVHAYDDYMQAVLCQVLEAHSAAGGSAILLSATLPLQARRELFSAYARGANWMRSAPASAVFGSQQVPAKVELPESDAYPLLTRLGVGQLRCEEHPFPCAESSVRSVQVDYRSDLADVEATIADAAAEGRCVCWIRNSVREAVESFERMQALVDPTRLILFHSRFALCDRLAIQRRVLDHFGRESDATLRRGWVLVATQVVEQSLDVDFDVLVSDLAPIDALLQRQGRLMRHVRDRLGNPQLGKDERGRPVLTVFGPDRNAAPDRGWIRRFSTATSRIYPAHGRLWMSAQTLGNVLHLPTDFREKVERVYGPDAAIPDCFDDADGRAHGERLGARAFAAANVVEWHEGYVATQAWGDDERIGTRLGDSIEAVLAVHSDGGLVPYADPTGRDLREAWSRSTIRVPAYWGVGQDAMPSDPVLAEAVSTLKAHEPALRWKVVVPLLDGKVMLQANAHNAALGYDSRQGLMRIPAEAGR